MNSKNQVNLNATSELTFEKLKTYKGFENVTELEAEKYINAIKKLARVLYGVHANIRRNRDR